jgi:hypothetical protein
MRWSAWLLGTAILVATSAPALPMSAEQRAGAIQALEVGDREARIEINSVQNFLKLKPGCLSEQEIADFRNRRKRFSDLRNEAGSWRDADDDTLSTALIVMRDNAHADAQLALQMKHLAKVESC